jgi:hypothetical protein
MSDKPIEVGWDSWFQTYTNEVFDLLNPKLETIHVSDIAHGLALQCRYNGATPEPYSIAQHSILVLDLVTRKAFPQSKGIKDWEGHRVLFCHLGNLHMVQWALMHDAAEAYLGDIVNPLKKALPDYQKIEARLEEAIKERFEIETPQSVRDVVKEADTLALLIERNAFHGPNPPKPWFVDSMGLEAEIPEDYRSGRLPVLSWKDAEREFVWRFRQLFGDFKR